MDAPNQAPYWRRSKAVKGWAIAIALVALICVVAPLREVAGGFLLILAVSAELRLNPAYASVTCEQPVRLGQVVECALLVTYDGKPATPSSIQATLVELQVPEQSMRISLVPQSRSLGSGGWERHSFKAVLQNPGDDREDVFATASSGSADLRVVSGAIRVRRAAKGAVTDVEEPVVFETAAGQAPDLSQVSWEITSPSTAAPIRFAAVGGGDPDPNNGIYTVTIRPDRIGAYQIQGHVKGMAGWLPFFKRIVSQPFFVRKDHGNLTSASDRIGTDYRGNEGGALLIDIGVDARSEGRYSATFQIAAADGKAIGGDAHSTLSRGKGFSPHASMPGTSANSWGPMGHTVLRSSDCASAKARTSNSRGHLAPPVRSS